MLWNIKLLCLAEILVIVSLNIEKIAGNIENIEDDDASIKQALFLIKLLKSDFGKIFRSSGIVNDEATTNFNEDANSTCGLRSDDNNTTTPTSTTPISTAVMGFNRRMMPDFANFRRQGETLNKTTTETRGQTKNGKSLNNTTTKKPQTAKHDQVESKNRKSFIKKTKDDNYSDEVYSDADENYSEELENDPEELNKDQVESKNSSSSSIASSTKSTIKPRIITKTTTKKIRTSRTTSIMTGKTFRSSLKIFLPHSSRLPIPFSENNAFCHFYPTNPICGGTT
ncbi:unnamed protein product [Spodoptera littoralis]|uniref:Uncharacterized protein n=1 Tax=Spodoptera littoralis TaxID=7109 RepID=A0A9P0N9U2_SPOLI|nr:unnamed protein product [Spodoptera littoralis]CAH1647651.1 unnamed protein product [Spodoptera littoralis]